MWAAKNLALKAGEGKVLAGLFANSSAAFSNGIMVGGIKHLCIRADNRSVYGKKVNTINYYYFLQICGNVRPDSHDDAVLKR